MLSTATSLAAGLAKGRTLFTSRWAIHFNSAVTNKRQLLDDLKWDGIHVLRSVEKKLVSRDEVGFVWFDRVLLIEVPDSCDHKLYFPETGEAQGRYAEWPYYLDAYQFDRDYGAHPRFSLEMDARGYHRSVDSDLLTAPVFKKHASRRLPHSSLLFSAAV